MSIQGITGLGTRNEKQNLGINVAEHARGHIAMKKMSKQLRTMINSHGDLQTFLMNPEKKYIRLYKKETFASALQNRIFKGILSDKQTKHIIVNYKRRMVDQQQVPDISCSLNRMISGGGTRRRGSSTDRRTYFPDAKKSNSTTAQSKAKYCARCAVRRYAMTRDDHDPNDYVSARRHSFLKKLENQEEEIQKLETLSSQFFPESVK